MKGIILDKLVCFFEERHGLAFREALLSEPGLESGGAYTAVGTYGTDELETLVDRYCRQTSTDRAAALKLFGEWLFPQLASRFHAVGGDPGGTFELLSVLHNVIHVEVRKLYDDAELPSFEVLERGADRMRVRYESSRRLQDFAEGLILGAVGYYGERIDVGREEREDATEFILERRPEP